MGQQETSDIQRGQEEIPTPGWAEPIAVTQPGDCPAAGQLTGRCPWGLVGNELDVEPAVGPGSKGWQQHPQLQEEKGSQQSRGSDCPPSLGTH